MAKPTTAERRLAPRRIEWGWLVPNEVYRQTRERLAGLVSARAAKRVLDNAMRRRGYSSDSISPHQMKGMLMGPVLSDLEAILPRAGLQRNLREVGRALDALHAPAEAPRPSAAPSTSVPTSRGATPSSIARSFQLETDDERPRHRPAGFVPAPDLPRPGGPSAPHAAAQVVEVEPDEVELVPLAIVDPQPDTGAADTPSPLAGKLVAQVEEAPAPAPTVEPLPANILKAAVLRFAKIESVQQVAALRSDGSVVEARGRAVDLDSLGLLISSSLGLLRRHGPIRSYYLQHSRGQMFLFPVGQDTLIVVGRTNLNLGAVFTALAALEEEL
jgi:hypothetical protein